MHAPESAIENAILEVVGDRKVARLLDLGTGTGRMLELLADRYVSGTGIDSSRDMLGVARVKLSRAGLAHAQVRLGDILDPENGPGADVVTIHQVLHYFDDPARVLNNAARQLVDGGRIIVVDFAPHELEFLRTRHHHRRLGMSNKQMWGWARSSGLSFLDMLEFANPQDSQGLKVCLWLLEKKRPKEQCGTLKKPTMLKEKAVCRGKKSRISS